MSIQRVLGSRAQLWRKARGRAGTAPAGCCWDHRAGIEAACPAGMSREASVPWSTETPEGRKLRFL